MHQTTSIPVRERSQVGEARRAATAASARLGFDETTRGQVAIVATEAANNLVAHAKDGQVLLRELEGGGLEIVALDRGPGIAHVEQCLEDGYSTAGTPGTGLGAIRRCAAEFDIYSVPGLGTALVARFWSGSPSPSRLEVSAVCLPKQGEQICGDCWAVQPMGGRTRLLVADGLGHGPLAAEASQSAVDYFRREPGRILSDVIQTAHVGLRPTRGAAVAVVEVDSDRRELRFVGIGNISGAAFSGSGSSRLISHNGTVGHQMPRVQEFVYPWPGDAVLVMASDGLATRWRLDGYPGLVRRHPSLIAGILYRDFCRGTDDVTVVVSREGGQRPRPTTGGSL